MKSYQMNELFDILEAVVLVSITLSIVAPLIFMWFGWMKPSNVRKYVKDLTSAYVMFALYGLVRLCM